MTTRIFCWLAVPLLLGVVSYLVAREQLHRAWSSVAQLNPAIEYPATIDLGERERGEVAVGYVTVANRGREELIVDQIRTNCSCTGLEQEKEGRFFRVESLRLKAGEKADLVIRVSVRGVPVGAAMVNLLEFRTNDPAQPTGRMEVTVPRVRGGVFTDPPSIFVGTVPIGAEVRHVLDVRDTALSPRKIKCVSGSPPDRLTVRLLPVEDAPRDTAPNPKGTLIGRIEVTVNTAKAGEIRGGISIDLVDESRRPDTVTVVGRVAAPFDLKPSSVVLPRQSADGPVYSARTICRSTHGEPLTLTVESVPVGLSAEVLAAGEAAMRVVRITWDPERGPAPAGHQRQLVRLRARAGKDEALLGLPVHLQK